VSEKESSGMAKGTHPDDEIPYHALESLSRSCMKRSGIPIQGEISVETGSVTYEDGLLSWYCVVNGERMAFNFQNALKTLKATA
jgi:hypothetical protein